MMGSLSAGSLIRGFESGIPITFITGNCAFFFFGAGLFSFSYGGKIHVGRKADASR